MNVSLYERLWGEPKPSRKQVELNPAGTLMDDPLGSNPEPTMIRNLNGIELALLEQEKRILDRVEQLEQRLKRRDTALAEILATLTGMDP